MYLVYNKIDKNSPLQAIKYSAIWLSSAIGIMKVVIEVLIDKIAFFQRLNSRSRTEIFKLKGRLGFSFLYLYSVIYTMKYFSATTQLFIENLGISLLLMIILPQIFAWIDFELIGKSFKRLFFSKKVIDDERTQKECDELFRNPEFPFAVRVNDSAQVYFLALSFYSVFPLAVPICIVALCVIYYNDKYMILRVFSKTKLTGIDMGLRFFKAFEYDVLIQLIGNAIYVISLSLSTSIEIAIPTNIIIVIVSLVVIFVYYGKFFESFSDMRLRHAPKVNVNESYDEVKFKLRTTYMMEYPLNYNNKTSF